MMNIILLSVFCLLINIVTFGQWEQKADPIFTKDHGIGFSLGGDGYVLTGGANGQVFTATKDFFKYDPNTDSWEQLTDYPGPARGYGIGDTWDGKLYFGFGIGSDNGLLDDLWSWDPISNVFTELPSCPCGGRVHPALVAVDGKVYAGAGGAAGNLNDWWVYDIDNQTWAQRTNIPETRHHPYQFEIDGEVYVGNGHRSSWYKFDANANDWIQIADLPTRVAGAQFSYNGKGYALSGADNDHNVFGNGEFWEYDPILDTWTALPPHPGNSRFAPTQFVIDNYIYFLAGYYRMGGTITPETTMWRYQLGPDLVSINGDMNSQEEISIYPNPASNEINITMTKKVSNMAIINIYNLSGQLLMSNNYASVLDISTLNNGMYLIEILDDGQSIHKQKISKN
jgi:N-acetylneuraminic acid mutarotase